MTVRGADGHEFVISFKSLSPFVTVLFLVLISSEAQLPGDIMTEEFHDTLIKKLTFDQYFPPHSNN